MRQISKRQQLVRAGLIALTLWVSYGYFYQAGGWNQNSRFDLLRAILDQHALRIDSYQTNTEDKALFGGHYYSDKAPGLVLLAVPVVAASRPILRLAGVDSWSGKGLVAQSYIATVMAVSLPVALAGACLFLAALRLGASVAGASMAALCMGLATPVWAWSTIFFGHAMVGAFLVFSFAAALRLREQLSPSRELLWGFVVGVMAGWATVSEYPAAPASVILAWLALAQVWEKGWDSRKRVAAGVCAGAGLCLAVLMTYQHAAFGSAFAMGYTHYESGAFPWMHKGFLGLGLPRVDVLFKLLFGLRLGLFFLGPITAAAVIGLRFLWKQKGTRVAAMAATLIALYYWLFNGAFSAWHGGWSYGPRYMGAGVPILCVGIAAAWDRAPKRWRWLLAGLTGWGAALSLMAVATTAQPPQSFRMPVTQLIMPSFWHGQLSLNQVSMLTSVDESAGGKYGAFNLGELAGLHGLTSLLPLLILWLAVLWVMVKGREAPDPS